MAGVNVHSNRRTGYKKASQAAVAKNISNLWGKLPALWGQTLAGESFDNVELNLFATRFCISRSCNPK